MKKIIALACLALLLLAAEGFRREYPAAVGLQSRQNGVLALLSETNDIRPPPSAQTLRNFMVKCGSDVITSQYARNESLHERLDKLCNAMAKATLERSPSHGRGLALDLLTSPAQEITAERYAKASLAAPYDPWSLSIRLLTAETVFSAADGADLTDPISADMEMALVSEWGRNFLAQMWVRKPELREIITAAASKLPAQHQSQFLNMTKRAMRNE